jgi:hypothetical protein
MDLADAALLAAAGGTTGAINAVAGAAAARSGAARRGDHAGRDGRGRAAGALEEEPVTFRAPARWSRSMRTQSSTTSGRQLAALVLFALLLGVASVLIGR